MSFANRPDRITLDSFSDTTLATTPNGGVFSQFTNQFNTPILNVKGLQLLRANFVNPILQLNDYSQLSYWYYRIENTLFPTYTTSYLHCVRLHPSWFVPRPGFADFKRNQYFNNGQELVTALNAAAGAGGDDVTYNPYWLESDILFSFNPATRRISVTGQGEAYYAPAAADDPNVQELLPFLTMYSFIDEVQQPYSKNITMNKRLGFGMSYNNNGRFWSITSARGCATATGVASATTIEGDSLPIMIGSQNLNIYASAIVGSGNDSRVSKNLLATIPLENVSQGVNSYTLSSVEEPLKSVSRECYAMTISFTDDFGDPVIFPPNTNVNLEIAVFY